MVVRRRCVAFLQIKGIDRLAAVQGHRDHLPAHVCNGWQVGVAAFDNGHLHTLPPTHQEHVADCHALSRSRSRGHDHVGVFKAGVEW